MRALVVVLFPREPLLERLKRVLGARADFTEVLDAHGAQAAKQIIATGVDIVVVCLGHAHPERELELIQSLRAATKGPILAIGPATDAKLILRTIQVGADVFVDQADVESEIGSALARLHLNANSSGPKGRLIGVLSVSGGCGASTLAVNIAAVLAKDHGRCGLIDLNPGQGDLASLLDLKPQHTLADVCKNEARLDLAMFEKMLTRHGSGIHLLSAPPHFEDVRALSTRGVALAVTLARTAFPHVVVDLEDCFHEEQTAVIQQASGVLLVGRLDFTALRNTRRVLDYLGRLGVARTRIKVVVNQSGQPNELPIDEAQDALGEQLTRFVPHDPKNINAANNTGMPAVLKCSNTKLVQAISDLARIDFESDRSSSGVFPVIRHLWKAIG